MLAQDHEPDDILQALRFGVAHTFTIRVRKLEVAVRALSISERVRIVNEVTAEMTAKPKEHHNSLTESALLAIHTLELASTPDPDRPQPSLPGHVLQKMTNDELRALYTEYNDACDLIDPAMETITEERLDELVKIAKKNASALTELPRPHLMAVLTFLATAVASLEANTSGG